MASLSGLAHGGAVGAIVELALVVGLGAILLLVLVSRRGDDEPEQPALLQSRAGGRMVRRFSA